MCDETGQRRSDTSVPLQLDDCTRQTFVSKHQPQTALAVMQEAQSARTEQSATVKTLFVLVCLYHVVPPSTE